MKKKRLRQTVNLFTSNFNQEAQEFIKYANEWWEDYKAIRSSHSTRLIKLFLPTEDREN